ncbi:hypothetical protein HY383_00805 [Candidatus Daviesbacteria bacterium]|nr:hypothetical protein [Candidatus Daviesbacteria bacterium]
MERVSEGLFDVISGGVRVALELGLLTTEGPYRPQEMTTALVRRMSGQNIDGLERQLLDIQRVMSVLRQVLDP